MKAARSGHKAGLRVHVDSPLAAGRSLALPPGAARHVQVLRAQPGDTVTLFDGVASVEWPARIVRIARQGVEVELGEPVEVHRELAVAVTLALGVPANDRMDALIEKAGELGAAAIQPLVCERSVVRVAEGRADAKLRHWNAVAAAASEQCGRARVATVLPVRALADWLQDERVHARGSEGGRDVVLSFDAAAVTPRDALAATVSSVRVLSGPEGGLTTAEERAAVARGFVPVGLGPRVLRADTAPLALLSWLALQSMKATE